MLAISVHQSVAAGATKEPKSMRAAAVVNDIIISTYDLEQRIKLVMVTSGSQGPDTAKRLRPQVLRQLVDELLQLQEAQKYNVKITQEDLDNNFKRIAQQNNISVDQIHRMLDENDISRSTLQNQMKADLAWQKLVQQKLAPRVTVSDDEVDEAFRQMQESSKKTQFAVSEIFIPVDSPELEDQARQNIQSILAQLRAGAQFSAIARQFSKAPSASNGGDIGLVTEDEMQSAVAEKVRAMSPGAISDPIRATGGFYVIGLREKRLPSGSKVEAQAPAPQPKATPAKRMQSNITIAQISIPLANGSSKAKEEAVRAQSIEIFKSVNGCASAGEIARSRGAKYQMIGQISTKDLAPQFVKILEQTPNGRSTPPLRAATGVEMYVICAGGMQPSMQTGGGDGPGRVTAQGAPSKEEVENRLFNQELSMLARRYMRDLRRDATIEMRDD